MSAPFYYSADMVRALPDDGKRYETVHGELLVSAAPSAWHQEIILRVLVKLYASLQANPVGHLFVSPADISWSDDTLLQPDLFVVDREEGLTLDWSRMKRLLLVIEVMSPSTARSDRFTKRRLYQEVLIPAYWILDPNTRQVEVWTPDALAPRVERERVTWLPAGAAEPFVLELDQLFHR